jgi:hypothetical protein
MPRLKISLHGENWLDIPDSDGKAFSQNTTKLISSIRMSLGSRSNGNVLVIPQLHSLMSQMHRSISETCSQAAVVLMTN